MSTSPKPEAPVLKKIAAVTLPDGALAAAVVLFVQAELLHQHASSLIGLYPYAVAVVGLIVAAGFHRNHLLLTLLMLALVDRSLTTAFGPSVDAQVSGFVYQLAGVLLPLNMAALALLPDRGGLDRHATFYLAALAIQVLIAHWVIDSGYAGASTSVLEARLFLTDVPLWSRLGILAVTANLGAVMLLGVRLIRSPGPLRRGYYWAAVIAYMALSADPRAFATGFYLASAGLILIVDVIPHSYSVTHRETVARYERIRERLSAVLEASPDFVGMLDPELRVIYVNSAGRRMLGMPRDRDLSGLHISNFHPRSAFERVTREGCGKAEREGTWRGESVLLTGEGREITILQTVIAHRAPLGHVEFFSVVMRDIDELVQRGDFLSLLSVATAAANEAGSVEEALRTVVEEICRRLDWAVGHAYLPADDGSGELVSSPIWHLEDEARFGEFRRLTDRTRFGPGTGLVGRVSETGRPEWIGDLRASDDRFRARCDGEDIDMASAFAFPVRVGTEAVAILEFFHDEHRPENPKLLEVMAQIGTELGRVAERESSERARKAIEEQARHAQKMEAVGRLAGGVAHDFNNILTVIIAEAQMALRKATTEIRAREPLQRIVEMGQRAARLTRQLLSFSRKEIVNPTVFRLDDVVTDMQKMLRRLISEGIELETRIDDLGTRPVRADRGQIEQVLANLVVNARDATSDGGRIIIETGDVELDEQHARSHSDARPGSYSVLTVRDNGAGIPEEIRTRVFEPFFTTKEEGKGTGLGLSTCYAIATQSGGFIRIDSEEGRGTVVDVLLPSVATQDLAVGEPAPAPVSGGDERVLLVEDEDALRRVTAEGLRSLGYHVIESPDGDEALERIDEIGGEIDLVITDLVMPGAGGCAVADSIQSRFPGVRVLFVTGYSDDTILRERVLESRAFLLKKPFTLDALGRRIRTILDAPPGTTPD